MAPERFAGQCDARSDVYSLGLTLYELVALRPAFEAPDRHALIERVLHEAPERLKKRRRACRGTWRRSSPRRSPVSRRAGTRRPPTLAEDLLRYVEDRPIRRGGSRRRSGWRGGAGGTRGWRQRSAWRPGAGHRVRRVAALRRRTGPSRPTIEPATPKSRRRQRRVLQGRAVRVQPPAGDARPGARPESPSSGARSARG